MEIKYSKDIHCKNCGSSDLSVRPAGIGGILYCTCKCCGEKFVAQTDDSDIISRYIIERQRLFAEAESASLSGQKDYSRVGAELGNLSRGFATIVDIDPLYYWYKLEYITCGFTDFDKENEAKTEYSRLMQDRFFVAQGDNTRDKVFENRWQDYVKKCVNKIGEATVRKRKKRTAIIACLSALLGVALIGVGTFVGVYRPSVNTDVGVSVTFENDSYGLLDKFNAKAEVNSVKDGEPEYHSAGKLLAEVSPKAELYSVSLLKGGVKTEPKGNVSYKIKLNENFRADRVCVYELSEDGSYTLIQSAVNTAGYVSFKSTHLGLFAIAEKPFVITYDCAGGSGAETALVPWGESVIAPSAEKIKRTGYTFAGWLADGTEYDFSAHVYKDTTLTAKWTANSYTVSYEIDGVTLNTDTVTFDEPFTLYQAHKTGYSLSWYYKEAMVNSGVWNIAENATLTGKWSPKTYSVGLDSGVDVCCDAVHTGTSSVTATFDNSLPTVTIPKRTGYVLKGYYTHKNGGGVKYLDGEGNGVANWTEDSEITLYANWTRDEKYTGYTYISTVDELYAMAGNTGGKYLLTRDLNLEGRTWSPLYFNGVLDGGCHSIYNYKITNGYTEGRDIAFGLFSILTYTGTVKNLQVGKEGFTTSIIAKHEEWKLHAGIIAGFSNGTVYNCRVVNCYIEIQTFCQSNSFSGQEFYVNSAGISGVQRGGSIDRCTVTGCTLISYAKTKYNNLQAMGRAGGICAYAADGCTVSNCYVTNSYIKAIGQAEEGAVGNWTGAPYARSGGMIAEALGSANINTCVVNGNTSVIIEHKWDDWWVKSGGNAYCGTMFGTSDDTRLSNLVGVSTWLNCSGTTGNTGFSTISNDAYTDLVARSSAFANGNWYSDGGKIALKFFED